MKVQKRLIQKAGGIKPDEKYPKDKIVEIDGILCRTK